MSLFAAPIDRRVLRSSAVADEIYVGNAATDAAARSSSLDPQLAKVAARLAERFAQKIDGFKPSP